MKRDSKHAQVLTSLPVFKTGFRQGSRVAKEGAGARGTRSRGEAVSAVIRRAEEDEVDRDASALDARVFRRRSPNLQPLGHPTSGARSLASDENFAEHSRRGFNDGSSGARFCDCAPTLRAHTTRSPWALPRGVIIFATHAVQPVWCDAPQPRPVSPSKYS